MRPRLLLIVFGIILAVTSPVQGQAGRVEAQRVAGVDRYETAVLTLIEANDDFCRDAGELGILQPDQTVEECQAGAVASDWTLARGDDFADALAASSVPFGMTS